MTSRMSRRRLLGYSAGLALGSAHLGRLRAQPVGDERFLVVLTAHGGASITDSFLAVSRQECAAAGGDPSRLVAFDQHPGVVPSGNRYALVRPVPGTPFRATAWRGSVNFGQEIEKAVDLYPFVQKHHRDMLVLTQTVSSVNHDTGQARSVTGAGAFRGRSIQEEMAVRYGASRVLPNVLLTTGSGFVRRGRDVRLDPRFVGEIVPDPLSWPIALGSEGLPLSRDLIRRARSIRDELLEPETSFARTFANSRERERWLRTRQTRQADLESAEVTRKLLLGGTVLGAAPEASRLREVFPTMEEDPVEAQAAMAFLLLKNRFSSSVTLGPNATGITVGSPNDQDFLRQLSLSFDYSHTDHFSGQLWMWDRVLLLADRLIDLLKAEPLDSEGQESMWDRTVMYFATEFGRQRGRPPNALEFTSGHALNNGVLMMSPLLRGNQVVGGVDPARIETYGPDSQSHYSEVHAYATLLGALDVDTSGSGLPDMSALVRG